MKSARRGASTLCAEVTNVSGSGFWILMDNRELFVPLDAFPWFREASIGQLVNVERPHAGHLYWPDLDVDLAVESIEHPEQFPLIARGRARVRPKRASLPATTARETQARR